VLAADRPPAALRMLVGSSWRRLLGGGGVAARTSFELSSSRLV